MSDPEKDVVWTSMLPPEHEVEEAEKLLDEMGVPRMEIHERLGTLVAMTLVGRLQWLQENAPGIKEIIQVAASKQQAEIAARVTVSNIHEWADDLQSDPNYQERWDDDYPSDHEDDEDEL